MNPQDKSELQKLHYQIHIAEINIKADTEFQKGAKSALSDVLDQIERIQNATKTL